LLAYNEVVRAGETRNLAGSGNILAIVGKLNRTGQYVGWELNELAYAWSNDSRVKSLRICQYQVETRERRRKLTERCLRIIPTVSSIVSAVPTIVSSVPTIVSSVRAIIASIVSTVVASIVSAVVASIVPAIASVVAPVVASISTIVSTSRQNMLVSVTTSSYRSAIPVLVLSPAAPPPPALFVPTEQKMFNFGHPARTTTMLTIAYACISTPVVIASVPAAIATIPAITSVISTVGYVRALASQALDETMMNRHTTIVNLRRGRGDTRSGSSCRPSDSYRDDRNIIRLQ